jgi:hypothetical protein
MGAKQNVRNKAGKCALDVASSEPVKQILRLVETKQGRKLFPRVFEMFESVIVEPGT